MMTDQMKPSEFETAARKAFNMHEGTNAEKRRIEINGKHHEFDLFQESVVVGGISTSPWHNATGSNNTGGQDRVAAELLWLHLCRSARRKVLILKRRAMADGISLRFGGVGFFEPAVEVWIYDENSKSVLHYSDL